MKNKKLITILAVVLIAALGLSVTAVLTRSAENSARENWYQATYDKDLISEYAAELDTRNEFEKEDDEVFENDIRNAEELRNNSFIKKANEGIRDFFLSEYDVDVTEKLERLHVFSAPLTNNYNGSYAPGTDNIYILTELVPLDNYAESAEEALAKTLFLQVYVHETIHYLGLCSDDARYEYLLEGMTESLNGDVISSMGYDYDNNTVYIKVKDIGRQLLTIDKNVISRLFSIDNGEDRNRFLEEEYGPDTGKAIMLLMTDQESKKYNTIAQYYTLKYAKGKISEEDAAKLIPLFVEPLKLSSVL